MGAGRERRREVGGGTIVTGGQFLLSIARPPYLLRLSLPAPISVKDEDMTVDERVRHWQRVRTCAHVRTRAAMCSCVQRTWMRAPRPAPAAPLHTPPLPSYMQEDGTFIVSIAKETPGTHFPDLDLITKLMQPHGHKPAASAPGAAADMPPVSATLFAPGRTAEEADEEAAREEEAAESADIMRRIELLEAMRARGAAHSSSGGGGGASRPLIQVIDSTEVPPSHAPAEREEACEPSGANAAAPAAECAGVQDITPPVRFGFMRSFSADFFKSVREDIQELLALPEPGTTLPWERRAARELEENDDFDAEHIVADAAHGEEDDIFREAVAHVPHWQLAAQAHMAAMTCASPAAPAWTWSEEEAKELRELRNREFIMDGVTLGASSVSAGTSAALSWDSARCPETVHTLCGMLSVLYAYVYDARLTAGEHNVESGWNIAALSPLLSWLDDDVGILPSGAPTVPDAHLSSAALGAVAALSSLGLQTASADAPAAGVAAAAAAAADAPRATTAAAVRRTLTACIRRSLVVPYIRRWDFSLLCARDTVTLLLSGKRSVLRCLLSVRRIMAHDELRYLFNSLFLDDLCVWIQSVPDALLLAAAMDVSALCAALTPDDAEFAPWRLSRLAHAARTGEPLTDDEEEAGSDDDSDDDSDEDGTSSDEEEEDGLLADEPRLPSLQPAAVAGAGASTRQHPGIQVLS
ncbi:hypothetical protein EON68_00925 [archaeon]|nr:MAG: hypothetical protein EON68_00925 [archaeon]